MTTALEPELTTYPWSSHNMADRFRSAPRSSSRPATSSPSTPTSWLCSSRARTESRSLTHA